MGMDGGRCKSGDRPAFPLRLLGKVEGGGRKFCFSDPLRLFSRRVSSEVVSGCESFCCERLFSR